MANAFLSEIAPFGGSSLSLSRSCASEMILNTSKKRESSLNVEGVGWKKHGNGCLEKSPPLLSPYGLKNGNGPKKVKVEPPKIPKYIDTRVADAYPVKKSSDAMKLRTRNQRIKDEDLQIESLDLSKDKKNEKETFGRPGSDIPGVSATDNLLQGLQRKTNSCSQSTFRHVAELSMDAGGSSNTKDVDMNLAFKGLGLPTLPDTCHSLANPFGRIAGEPSTSTFQKELHIDGNKAPIDFVLKSGLRLVSSSSLSWCHRAITKIMEETAPCCIHPFAYCKGQNHCAHHKPSDSSKNSNSIFYEALQSWSFPLHSLPSAIISALTLSAALDDSPESDFLSRRLLDWQDSFRSLYHLFRRDICGTFYVCTSQFIAMFISGEFSRQPKRFCGAYVSRSTRGLRSLLKENDVEFSMPLCSYEVDYATSEDLRELSDFEKSNPGQTYLRESMYDLDNTSESLLAFTGNENVHGLFDVLLNYRSIINSLAGADVPVLYAPVSFKNASSYCPQVLCKQMKKADTVTSSESLPEELQKSTSICYSMELRDTVIPPWVISRLCKVIGLDDKTFEASFTVHPLSSGLNIAIESIFKIKDIHNAEKDGSSIDLENSVLHRSLRMAYIEGLTYRNRSYQLSLSPS